LSTISYFFLIAKTIGSNELLQPIWLGSCFGPGKLRQQRFLCDLNKKRAPRGTLCDHTDFTEIAWGCGKKMSNMSKWFYNFEQAKND
jgi:hypothetical protein